MTVELDNLTAQVQANKSAEDSATILVNGIAARVTAAANAASSLSPSDKAALIALAADLKAHADPLAAAVVANTPAATA